MVQKGIWAKKWKYSGRVKWFFCCSQINYFITIQINTSTTITQTAICPFHGAAACRGVCVDVTACGSVASFTLEEGKDSDKQRVVMTSCRTLASAPGGGWAAQSTRGGAAADLKNDKWSRIDGRLTPHG